ncbi:hypothetical protein TNCV_4150981 [Trichonephila clavipes]|nr:hypothetical protein TNCV_4150981 [Trichonephila clavipes]
MCQNFEIISCLVEKLQRFWRSNFCFRNNAPGLKFRKMMVKLNEFSFELLSQPPYSPVLALPIDYQLFADLKTMLQEKRFVSNEEVIAEGEAYLENKEKSFNEKGIKN